MSEIKNWRQVNLDTKIYLVTTLGKIFETNIDKFVNLPEWDGLAIEFGNNDSLIEIIEIDNDVIEHNGIHYSYNRDSIFSISKGYNKLSEIKSWKEVSLGTKIYYTMFGSIYETKVMEIHGSLNLFSIEFSASEGLFEVAFDIEDEIIKYDGKTYSYNRERLIPIAMEYCDGQIRELTKRIKILSEEISEYKEKIEKLKKYT